MKHVVLLMTKQKMTLKLLFRIRVNGLD